MSHVHYHSFTTTLHCRPNPPHTKAGQSAMGWPSSCCSSLGAECCRTQLAVCCSPAAAARLLCDMPKLPPLAAAAEPLLSSRLLPSLLLPTHNSNTCVHSHNLHPMTPTTSGPHTCKYPQRCQRHELLRCCGHATHTYVCTAHYMPAAACAPPHTQPCAWKEMQQG